MSFNDIVSMIQDWTLKVTIIAWAVVGLAWAIGWALRGAPIPITRFKRVGHGIVEDAIIAALWLAMGSTVFYLISILAKSFLPHATVNVTLPVEVR